MISSPHVFINFFNEIECYYLRKNKYTKSVSLNKFVVSKFVKTSDVLTDYGRPDGKLPSLHGRKFTPTPKFLGTAAVYFVCHIGPNFQISLIYAFIGCP